MIKKLFFLAAMLVPGLAFGGNPSADLSVQIRPAGSGPTPPAGASAAGFTTLALTLDFQTNQACIGTTCVAANSLANWFDKAGASSPMWCLGTLSLAKNVILKQDPVFNVPVLDLQFLQADYTRTSPAVLQTEIDTLCNGSGPAGNFTFPVMNVYAEATFRNDAISYSACPPASSGCFLGVFWSYAPNYAQSGPFFEWDFTETYGGNLSCGGPPCLDGGIPHANGGAIINVGTGSFVEPHSYDKSQFNTFAWRNTSDSSGNLSECFFLNGTRLGCSLVGTYSPVPIPNNFLIIENGPQGGPQPVGDEHAYFKSVHIWTCATWQTTGCFTTPLTN
jgi:hypothetical protein